MTINQICRAAFDNAVAKGFYDNPPSIAERLCLIHSEVSEALEADRKGHYLSNEGDLAWALSTNDDSHFYQEHFPEKIKGCFEDELADIVIRVFDLAASRGIDLGGHIAAKMRYNSLRPYKHGKKY